MMVRCVRSHLAHPATHVGWSDTDSVADAFGARVGGRLPTETEQEYAAHDGPDQALPVGRRPHPGRRAPTRHPAGAPSLPTRNTAADGSAETAPVHAYEPNGHGLCNGAGDVGEWCADP